MGARIRAWAGVATATVLLMAGCGSDSGGAADDTSSPTESVSSAAASAKPSATATTTPAPAGTPECSAVWKDGARLPRVYRGCAADGLLVAPDRIGCSSGQALVRYGQRFWAVAGGPVARTQGPLLDDQEYAAALTSCRG